MSTGCDGTEGLVPQEVIDELGGIEKAKAYFEEISKVFTEEYRIHQVELERIVKESGASESDILEARIEAGEDDDEFPKILSQKVWRPPYYDKTRNQNRTNPQKETRND